jgi:DNA polymerase elongation subunit (family B)
MWDALIYNHLREQDMVLPPIVSHSKNEQYVGAYVKEPVPGLYKWIASFDLNSLYPHLIMQYNISPETLIEPKDYDEKHLSFLSKNISIDTMLSASIDTSSLDKETITPNGQFFRTDKQGFLPEMMEKMYDDRTVYKKKSIDAKKELELETDP